MGILSVSDAGHGKPSSSKPAGVKFVALVVPILALGLCSCDLLDKLNPQKPADNSAQQQKIPLPQHELKPLPLISSASSHVKKDGDKPALAAAKPEQPHGPGTQTAAVAPKAPNITPKPDKAQNNGKKAVLPQHDGAQQKAATAKKDEAKPKQQMVKPATPVTVQKNAAAPRAAQNNGKKTSAPEATAAASTAKKPHPGHAKPWSVVAGPYLLEETLAADLAKVKKTGLTPAVQAGIRKRSPMHRLYVAKFDDRATAQVELDKLKKLTADAFILDHGGKHVVYAGSYLLDSRATSEKERLAAAGVNVTVSNADVAIPSKRLLIGTYRDKTAAAAAVKKLKDAGIQDIRLHQ